MINFFKYQIRLKNRSKSVLKLLLILFTMLSQVFISPAQSQPNEGVFNPNLQVGITAGTSIFFGDIKQNPVIPISEYMNEWRFAYGLNFNYNVSYVFNVRVQGLYGKLSGTNQEGKIWFENDYYELNINAAINFNNLFGKKRNDRLANVFGVLGFGILNYNTVVKRLGDYFVYKRVGYGYGTGIDGRQRQTFFMVGAGVDFRVNRRLNILIETASKLPDSDEIDGVESGKYYDLYNYTSIGITYRFAFLKKRKNEPKLSKTVYQLTPMQTIKTKGIDIELAIHPEFSIVHPVIQPIVKVQTSEEPITFSKIEYRIQICAEYAKPLSKTWISDKYQIPTSEIKENFVNGYYVYSTGSFPTFKKASVKCKELKMQNGIQDAFVVAFKDEKRILPVTK